jgi:hypothetical protein
MKQSFYYFIAFIVTFFIVIGLYYIFKSYGKNIEHFFDTSSQADTISTFVSFINGIKSVGVGRSAYYLVPPTIVINPGSSAGALAEITAILEKAHVTDTSLTVSGSYNFSKVPIFTMGTFQEENAYEPEWEAVPINTVIIENQGLGYTSVPNVVLDPSSYDRIGAGNTNVSFTAILDGDKITRIIINNGGGSGYKYKPLNNSFNLLITGGGGSGASAKAYNGLKATAVLETSGIHSVQVINGGSGYSLPVAISIDPTYIPAGLTLVAPTFTAVLNASGSITSINVTNNGSGYRYKNEYDYFRLIIIGNGGNGTSAVARAYVSASISTITIENRGFTYRLPPKLIYKEGSGGEGSVNPAPDGLSLTLPYREIESLIIDNTGQGYDLTTSLSTNPTGFTDTVGTTTATSENNTVLVPIIGTGELTQVTVNPVGTKTYSSAPRLCVSLPPQGGTRATVEAILNNNKIDKVNILTYGSGYTSSPSIQILEGSASCGTQTPPQAGEAETPPREGAAETPPREGGTDVETTVAGYDVLTTDSTSLEYIGLPKETDNFMLLTTFNNQKQIVNSSLRWYDDNISISSILMTDSNKGIYFNYDKPVELLSYATTPYMKAANINNIEFKGPLALYFANDASNPKPIFILNEFTMLFMIRFVEIEGDNTLIELLCNTSSSGNTKQGSPQYEYHIVYINLVKQSATKVRVQLRIGSQIIKSDFDYNVLVNNDVILFGFGFSKSASKVSLYVGNKQRNYTYSNTNDITLGSAPFIINKSGELNASIYSFAYYKKLLTTIDINNYINYNKYYINGIDVWSKANSDKQKLLDDASQKAANAQNRINQLSKLLDKCVYYKEDIPAAPKSPRKKKVVKKSKIVLPSKR